MKRTEEKRGETRQEQRKRTNAQTSTGIWDNDNKRRKWTRRKIKGTKRN